MKTLFKWFTLESECMTNVRITWFASTFGVQDFEGAERLLMSFLVFCRDVNVVAKRKYLESYLRTEGRKDIKKHDVRIDSMERLNYDEPAAFEEAYKIIVAAVLNTYDAYTSVDLDEADFKVDARAFLETKKTEVAKKVIAESFPLLSQGLDADEILMNLRDKITTITKKYDTAALDKLDFMAGEKHAKGTGGKAMKFLFKTGIPCIDGDTQGVYSKQLVSVAGQPGSGKTRFAMNFAYQAAVVWKLDVLFDELEMSAAEIENMFVAHHIVNLYQGKIKIPDKLINTDRLSEEQRRYVEAARMDLFESNGKYGTITIRDEGIVAETFEEDMYTYLRHNNGTCFWVIDYAGLTKTVPQSQYAKPLLEFERIQELYKGVKEICKNADIAALILNQYTESGNKAAYAGKRILPGDVQGGQIIQRHSDYDLAVTMTEAQEIAGIRMLSNIKRRAATGFQNVPFTTELSVSIFKQMDNIVKA